MSKFRSAGDADLYVSDVHAEPTFDFERHEMSSITCGVDVIDLPTSLKRPVNIAVYGHPRLGSTLIGNSGRHVIDVIRQLF